MRNSKLVGLAACVVALALEHASAQTPKMPVPLAVVNDADGKAIVQVLGIDDGVLHVLFNFDGVPAMFDAHPDYGYFGPNDVWFSGEGCTGDAYIREVARNVIDDLTHRLFVIAGSDHSDGSYRVFRTTEQPPSTLNIRGSRWFQYTDDRFGRCLNVNDSEGQTLILFPAEEILPNPLQGFHGPTTANPERVLTVEGGTRLP